MSGLISRVKAGDLSGVREMLDSGADVHVTDSNKRTALHEACESGNKAMVELLLSHGASCDLRDYAGDLPLHLSSFRGDLEIVKIIASKTKDIDVRGKYNQTALMNAALVDHSSVVTVLLTQGADVHIRDYRDGTALHYAKSWDVVQQLLTAGCPLESKDDHRQTPLLKAAIDNSLSAVRCLLHHGAKVNHQGHGGLTATHRAVYQGDVEMVKILLSRRPDLSLRGGWVSVGESSDLTVMEVAEKEGKQEILQVLNL